MHTDLPEVHPAVPRRQSYGYVDDSGTIVGEPDMNFIMLQPVRTPP